MRWNHFGHKFTVGLKEYLFIPCGSFKRKKNSSGKTSEDSRVTGFAGRMLGRFHIYSPAVCGFVDVKSRASRVQESIAFRSTDDKRSLSDKSKVCCLSPPSKSFNALKSQLCCFFITFLWACFTLNWKANFQNSLRPFFCCCCWDETPVT